jgi:peptide/nickel transport system ATP-binding protein
MKEAAFMLLEVRGLTTSFPSPSGIVRAVNDVSFQIDRGEVLAVVGESGSGKSVTALSATRLVPQPPAVIESGSVLLDGIDILALKPRAARELLGRRIGMLFQNAYAALHPIVKIGEQLRETVSLHRRLGKVDATRVVFELLKSVGLKEPDTLTNRYPFEVSAGDAQRVMLALALAGQPDLLIADEPTSLLDAIAQDEILTLLKQMQSDTGMAVWIITHDFGVVSRLADRVVVMYAGRAVEAGRVEDILRLPRHPYSAGLIAAVPSDGMKGRLLQISGEIPDLTKLPSGCSFRPRCQHSFNRCGEALPDMIAVQASQEARCWLYADA